MTNRHRTPLAQALGVTPAELTIVLGEGPGDETFASLPMARGGSGFFGRVGIGELADLRRDLSRLSAEYESEPSTALLAGGGEVLGRISLLSSQPARETIERELRSLEAEASILMGMLVWDSSQRRQNTTAQSYFEQAAVAARSAGDGLHESYAQLRLSFVELYGRNNSAMGLIAAEEARRRAPTSSWVLNGLTTLHMAEAHAMSNRRRDCERALSEAERCFGRITGSDEALKRVRSRNREPSCSGILG